MLRHLSKDQGGAAAIEFAIIAPLMITLYCGLAESSLGLMAERRASHATSVVADLVAQEPSTSASEMADVFYVGDSIMSPFDPTTLKIAVSSVTADSNIRPKVDWSLANRTSARSAGAIVSGFPSGMLVNQGDSMIMAEVSYQYTFPLPGFMPNTMSFSQTFYLKPRRSAQVGCDSPCTS